MKQGLIIGIFLLLSAGMLAGVFFMQSQAYLEQNARAICMQTNRIEFDDTVHGAVIVSPNKVEVEKCMEGL